MRLRKRALPSVELPSKLSKPVADLSLYSILLYGGVKIGKTTLAAEFEEPLMLMFEPGAKALAVRQMTIHSWPEYLAILDALEASPDRFRTVVLDTVDIAFVLCQQYVCAHLAIEHPTDLEYGKGWSALRNEFFDGIRRVVVSGRGSIFIAHEQRSEVRRRGGGSPEHMIETAITGQAKAVFDPLVDIWAYYGRNSRGEREIQIVGDTFVAAGHRVKGRFCNPDGTPIETIPAGNSPREAYRNFVAAFANKLQAGKEAPRARSRLAVRVRKRL